MSAVPQIWPTTQLPWMFNIQQCTYIIYCQWSFRIGNRCIDTDIVKPVYPLYIQWTHVNNKNWIVKSLMSQTGWNRRHYYTTYAKTLTFNHIKSNIIHVLNKMHLWNTNGLDLDPLTCQELGVLYRKYYTVIECTRCGRLKQSNVCLGFFERGHN